MTNRLLIAVNLFIATIVATGNTFAQVPVRNEPHHKVVLENDYVRLIEVHIRPGDTTLTHIHAAPSVIVFLSKSKIGTQIVGAEPAISDVMPGQTSYAAYDEKPIAHRVWNRGDSLFHVMDIELAKKAPAKDSCAIIGEPGFKLQIVKKLVHVYSMTLVAGQVYQISGSGCAHLLIDISGRVSARGHSLTNGQFYFYPPQTDMVISAKEDAQCVLLELK